MNRYALIEGGSVSLITEQDSTPILPGLWVNVTGMNVGPLDKYDGQTFTKHVPPPPQRIITKAAFRFRLTDPEYVAILSESKTNVEVIAWVETFNMSTTIDLNNQRIKDGLQVLVRNNLLTQSRADEILNNPIQQNEGVLWTEQF
jgi:hypothetical protein